MKNLWSAKFGSNFFDNTSHFFYSATLKASGEIVDITQLREVAKNDMDDGRCLNSWARGSRLIAESCTNRKPLP